MKVQGDVTDNSLLGRKKKLNIGYRFLGHGCIMRLVDDRKILLVDLLTKSGIYNPSLCAPLSLGLSTGSYLD